MKTIIVIILGFFLITGCKTKRLTKDIKKEFTNCFEGKNTNIRSLINIDGYYLLQHLEKWCWGPENNCKDTFNINIIFYEDGTFVYNFFSRYDYPKDIPGYLKKVYQNAENNHFYYGFYWGIYRIEGDTIIAQYLNHTNGMAPWIARERWFKVIDRNTLECIFSKPIGGGELAEFQKKAWEESMTKYLPAQFIPLEVIPPPNCWLKEREWFWCNKRNQVKN
ncbi:MAG: hypothetical protein B6D61_03270 [Bacteroidetes bacterium 4484_249]|nr:MAG: hypothetical protein B6D61_03270 [Bacteroidetes bacterium 4484_249]